MFVFKKTFIKKTVMIGTNLRIKRRTRTMQYCPPLTLEAGPEGCHDGLLSNPLGSQEEER